MNKFLIKVMVFLIGISCGADGENLPDDFFLLKPIDLPVGRMTSFPQKRFSLEGNSLKTNESGQPIYGLYQYLMVDKNSEIFSMNHEKWSGYRDANEKNSKWLRVANIPCVQPFKCFLVNPDSGSWIVVSRDKKITDFQLSRALQYAYDDKKQINVIVGALDTMFGEVGLFPYPETDYEKTGIFCSVITTTSPTGEEKVQIFKRRITPEGKIENKAMPEGVHECKLPW